jgi:hypothetical protein
MLLSLIHYIDQRVETGFLRVKIMCPSAATCLHQRVETGFLRDKRMCQQHFYLCTSSFHLKVTCSHHDKAQSQS